MNPSLNEVVFAPINAVSEANRKLSEDAVRFLKGFSKAGKDGETVLGLETVQIQYEQLRNNPLDSNGYIKDTVGIDVPLLALCPIGFLKVAKSKIAFSVEVQDAVVEDSSLKLYSSISSDSAYHPNISFEIEMESVNSAEGMSRIIDELNLKSVPKLIKSMPADESGNPLDKDEARLYRKRNDFAKRETALRKKIQRLQQLIEDEITASGYKDSPDNPYDRGDADEIAEIERDNIFIEKYRERKAIYENELNELRDELTGMI